MASLKLLVLLGALAACAQPPPDAALHQGGTALAAPSCANCGGDKAAAAAAQRVRVPVGDSEVLGPRDALVTIIEFTDYQCPFCTRAEATVQALLKEYGPRLRLVMKHSPLPMHPNALPAAKAALAAGLQGKFWPMHQALFAKGSLDAAAIEEAAQAAGVDLGHLRASVGDARLDQAIQRDLQLARTVGANGTPAFFINGRSLVGAQPIEKFRAVIDQELAAAEALVRAGTPRDGLYAKLMEAAAERVSEERAPAQERVKVEAGDSPAKGPRAAPVTVVIFSDFQCPYCARGASVITSLEEKYGDRLRFVFKNKPLPFHQNARGAAAAALAAAEQGKFWELHDALFAHQGSLDRAGLLARANELKLDLMRFEKALDRGADAALAADEAEAQRLGVTATPTFFINGRRVVGAQPVETMAHLVDEELKR